MLTGSLISALSLGLMLLVSRQLRVGLFELNALQAKLQSSRSDLERSRQAQANAARELKQACTEADASLMTIKQQVMSDQARLAREEIESWRTDGLAPCAQAGLIKARFLFSVARDA